MQCAGLCGAGLPSPSVWGSLADVGGRNKIDVRVRPQFLPNHWWGGMTMPFLSFCLFVSLPGGRDWGLSLELSTPPHVRYCVILPLPESPRAMTTGALPSPWAHRPQECPLSGLISLQLSHLDKPQFKSQGYRVNHVIELIFPHSLT